MTDEDTTPQPTHDDFDEFEYVDDIAHALDIASPLRPRRLTHEFAGGTISALAWGDEPPLVTYLHGAGLNAHTFDTTIIAAGVPALSIDLPGHGDSSWREDADYRPQTIAPAVAEAIAAWTTSPQVLVGQSLGGLTAAAVAAAHPELVAQLLVVDITPGIDPDGGASQIREFFAGPRDFASREELLDRAVAFGLGGSRESARRGVFLNSRVRPDGRVVWKHHFADLASRAAAGDLPIPSGPASTTSDSAEVGAASLVGEASWHDLAAVRAPITLLRGDRGFVTEANAAEFGARVPEASVLAVASGHNVQEDAPRDLAALVLSLAQ